MRQEGIEPPTYSLEGCCSIQLSYWRFDEHKEPLGPSRSGRPDLNRGPPAPKAGAIPGYATPRERSNVSGPMSRINCSTIARSTIASAGAEQSRRPLSTARAARETRARDD